MFMYFTTSTVKDWYPLLKKERFRKIVMDSLSFLIEKGRIMLHGYVIIPNHIHTIFSVLKPFHLFEIFRDFHKFTSQQILKVLRNEESELLVKFQSEYVDRKFQIWQTTHAAKEIVSMNYPAASSGVSQRTWIVDAASGGESDPSELSEARGK